MYEDLAGLLGIKRSESGTEVSDSSPQEGYAVEIENREHLDGVNILHREYTAGGQQQARFYDGSNNDRSCTSGPSFYASDFPSSYQL